MVFIPVFASNCPANVEVKGSVTSQKHLIQLIKSQIEMEESTANKIQAIEEDMANVAAKLFLAEMRFDTEKHAKILRRMLDLTEKFQTQGSPSKFWQIETREFVDAVQVKDMLDTHIKVETKMLQHMKEGMKQTDDEALKMLFEHISDDEQKHHRILQIIREKAFKIKSLP